ncbi:SMI1/KNR4 family protein [Nocardia sp. CA-136227]|uniref:SMI1/KNR4 family protein n=1 Tax=Nocardia sp. CA-136227 TaxID=3239979 RepID=UPI003D958922
MTNWNALVGKLFTLQCDVAERLGEPDLSAAPNPPATDAEIDAAEQRLGVSFDAAYRDFLRCCDGWSRFGNIHLFGAGELATSEKWRRASAFAEVYFATAASGSLVVPQGYRRVVVGKTAVPQRFIVMLFPVRPPRGANACWDCLSGADLCYPGFGVWAREEAAAISNALCEEIADERCLR